MQRSTFLCKMTMNIYILIQNTYCNIIRTMLIFLITQGEKCDQCNTTTHIHCLKNYAMTRGGLECPNCHHPISQHDQSSNILSHFLISFFVFVYLTSNLPAFTISSCFLNMCLVHRMFMIF